MMAQDYVGPIKEQAGTELNIQKIIFKVKK